MNINDQFVAVFEMEFNQDDTLHQVARAALTSYEGLMEQEVDVMHRLNAMTEQYLNGQVQLLSDPIGSEARKLARLQAQKETLNTSLGYFRHLLSEGE